MQVSSHVGDQASTGDHPCIGKDRRPEQGIGDTRDQGGMYIHSRLGMQSRLGKVRRLGNLGNQEDMNHTGR